MPDDRCISFFFLLRWNQINQDPRPWKPKLTSLPEDSPPEPETQASEHDAITPHTLRTPSADTKKIHIQSTERIDGCICYVTGSCLSLEYGFASIKPSHLRLVINLWPRCQFALVIEAACERLKVTAALRWLDYHPRMNHTCACACTHTLSSMTHAHTSCCYSFEAAWLICFIFCLPTVSLSRPTCQSVPYL